MVATALVMSETRIQFLLDEVVLRLDLESDPAQAGSAELENTWFEMPTALRVGGVELFESPAEGLVDQFLGGPDGTLERVRVADRGSRWRAFPLLGMVGAFARLMRSIRLGRDWTMELPAGGRLLWTLRQNLVHVESAANGRTACAPLRDVAAACRAFSRDVEEMLTERVPGLRSHEGWKSWFPGES